MTAEALQLVVVSAVTAAAAVEEWEAATLAGELKANASTFADGLC